MKIANPNSLEKMDQFLVIGLGRFGKSVAETLALLDNDVLVIDTDPKVLKSVEDVVTRTAIADCTSPEVLVSLGSKNIDCAIVCVGNDIQSSILITMACKEVGIKYIVVKAINEVHKKVLEKIGADMVVFPEDFMGKKIGQMLSSPKTHEIAQLNDDFKIIEMLTPESWKGKTIQALNAREKYRINIVFIKKCDNRVMLPEAETILENGDILIIAGTFDALGKIEKLATELMLNSI